ncbi:MAG: TonB-dependent receptor [Rikenellaceae bacterium]
MIKKLLLLFLCSLTLQLALAQQRVVTGRVVDSDNEPLIGAAVVVKDTTIGTSTDLDGNYSIKLPKGDKTQTLVFVYIGMREYEVGVSSSTTLNVVMESDDQILEDVIVIGYGTVRRKELTGATIQVSQEAIEKTVSADLNMALQGMVPGLNVTASSGDPGSSANVQIRGISSISGSNTPLYVIDGVPQEGDPMISSNEVKQIDVLKDAASCAIYGTRGAAGVILITTKQGDSDKLHISFDATYGIQEINEDRLPSLMGTADQTYFNLVSGRIDGYYDSSVNIDIDKRPIYYTNDTNVYDILVNNYQPEQSYNVTISGGTGKMRFSSVAGYYSQDGVISNGSYDRFNFRTNLSYSDKKVKFSVRTSYMLTEQNKANASSIRYAIKYLPYSPSFTLSEASYVIPSDGDASTEAIAISRLIRTLSSTNYTEMQTASVDMNFDYSFTDNLSFSTVMGLRSQSSLNTAMTPNVTIYNDSGDIEHDGYTTSSISNTSVNRQNYTFSGGLNYNKKWTSGHKFSAIAHASYEQYNNAGFTAGKEGLLSDDVYSLDAGTINTYANATSGYVDQLFGLISRVMYDYKSRYLFSASVRADASSKFSAANRWGVFPSMSAGWNVSDEKFWRPMEDVVSIFKIRASYGTTGNQNFTSYSYSPTLEFNYDYSFGSYSAESLSTGVIQVSYANPDLKWETSVQANLGIDLGFFNNKILFTADVYDTQKRDMLATVKLPPSAGATEGNDALVVRNIGNMTNQGIELSLSYKYQQGDFFFNSSVNYAKNKNEITSLGNDGSIIYNSNSTVISGDPNSAATVFAEGYEAGAFFLYKTNGIANTEEKLAEYQKISPDAEMGDLIFVDTNNDDSITGDDRTYCGSGMADYTMGLNLSFGYKGFDLTTNWYASIGNEAINGSLAEAYSSGRHANLIYMWSYENTDSEIPTYRGTSKNHSNYVGNSDLWVEDASYLRMQLLSLGYTFNGNTCKFLPVGSSARIYISCQNLLTFTSYSGLDPEIGGNGLSTSGIDAGNYPISKKYLLGVKMNF